MALREGQRVRLRGLTSAEGQKLNGKACLVQAPSDRAMAEQLAAQGGATRTHCQPGVLPDRSCLGLPSPPPPPPPPPLPPPLLVSISSLLLCCTPGRCRVRIVEGEARYLSIKPGNLESDGLLPSPEYTAAVKADLASGQMPMPMTSDTILEAASQVKNPAVACKAVIWCERCGTTSTARKYVAVKSRRERPGRRLPLECVDCVDLISLEAGVPLDAQAITAFVDGASFLPITLCSWVGGGNAEGQRD